MKNIAKALLSAQMEMSNPKKDKVNPRFNYKYADLNAVREAVLPVLNKHGIVVMQTMEVIDGKNFINTALIHTESGERFESKTQIVFDGCDAQKQGSGITYARRYGLISMLCLGMDDDDGNQATSGNKAAPSTSGNKPTTATPNSFKVVTIPADKGKSVIKRREITPNSVSDWSNAINYCRAKGVSASKLLQWYDISEENIARLDEILEFSKDLDLGWGKPVTKFLSSGPGL